jgi:hypothetical protein
MADAPSSLSEASAIISALRARASDQHCVIPEPPEAPLPENCCERGCERCVLTVYYEAVDEWRRQVEAKLG